ncbi:hypothetical protein P7D43_05280 [Enterococcus avium]|uniref:Uncharacterized protein n=1 Tax=Enterococcus avium TaxID=33945 RepID=A0AAW8SLP7_ENTAV|nr:MULTISPECIES: hypothetical protein [Enterococcus]MDT2401778.1 hypothetical protein [Enterococcus avium]MDT2434220.1 hypothetical protein [Enterococcus avium]MDT2466118.1 hypothetical protein [Enterococcus avium]MDT2484065.1 hypothetical protein [Enterococcus avium]MDT2505544.1 hypothetical protein [Enterococcus avium]
MYNEKRVKLIQRLAIVVLFAAGLLAGLGIGQLTNKPDEKNHTKQEQTVKKTIEDKSKKKELTSKDVQNFLIAYYTKKDLSENRKRYKPFMTTAMYTQETDIEDLPINQAYKGYVINQVFDEANIYIDSENLVALVEVKYHNTQLVEKGTTEGALVDTPETQTLKLTFTEENKRFKVNNINKIFLTTTGETPRNNTYEEEDESEETKTTDSNEKSENEEEKTADSTSTTDEKAKTEASTNTSEHTEESKTQESKTE